MSVNKVTDSITRSTTQPDLEVKTETFKSEITSAPDFISLKMSPKPTNTENSTVLNEKNGQKRIQSPIDGTSKKPRINIPGDSSPKKAEKVDPKKEVEDDMDQSSETEEYYLTVHNLPTDWTYVQIKNYLDQECGHVDEMEMLKHRKSKNCAIRLTFQSIDKCTEVFHKLQNKYVKDKKLKLKISDTYTTFPAGVTIPSSLNDSTKQFNLSNEINESKRWRPDLDCWDIDPEGLYGLRPEFLESLNIQPPLNKMVHVANFRCDRSELREVMELAGNVLMCCVVATGTKYAKVMYSHPLEAVQAISMLNGQSFYGIPLKITMDKNLTDTVVLPKGLATIGQGLGLKARPIRNIVHQYHRYANKLSSQINPIVFTETHFNNDQNIFKSEEDTEEVKKKIKEFMTSRPGCNIMNTTVKINDLECPDDSGDKAKGNGKKTGVASPQDVTKKVPVKQQSNSPKTTTPASSSTPPHPLLRLQNPGGFRPNLPMNPAVPMQRMPNPMQPMPNPMPPMPNPMPPMPNPMQNMPNPMQPMPCDPFFRPGMPQDSFGPRVPFMPPSMQRPPFPQPRPPFAPPGGPGMRPPIPPNLNGPRANIGNRVSVKFSNLPPSTTFPLLCELLAQCGQVMSVQLTTPGCAVAKFGHPSHAEMCYQNFNGKTVDGFVIEVGFV